MCCPWLLCMLLPSISHNHSLKREYLILSVLDFLSQFNELHDAIEEDDRQYNLSPSADVIYCQNGCGRHYAHYSNMRRHMVHECFGSERRFQCSVCLRKFNHKHHLKNHCTSIKPCRKGMKQLWDQNGHQWFNVNRFIWLFLLYLLI